MAAESPGIKYAVRLALSVLIIGHLVAIVAPPLAFQTQGPMGSSPSVNTLLVPVRAYAQMLYLDRGYAFFAPDPGPSHLIQAAITDPTGQRTEIMIPDLDAHWPRLRYHRHFMLAEFLTEIHQPPGPPQELVDEDPVGARFWLQARARYEYVRQSIVDHLRHENPGQEVAIRRIEHLIPSFQESIELTDPQLYTVLLDQPIYADGEMELPSGPPETIPAPTDNDSDDRAPEESDGTPADPVNESDETNAADPSEDKDAKTNNADAQAAEPSISTGGKNDSADLQDASTEAEVGGDSSTDAGSDSLAPDADEKPEVGNEESTAQAEASA